MVLTIMVSICVFVFIISDLVFSSLLLGIDGANDRFSFLYLKYSLGQASPKSYSFTTSLCDFWLLSLLRSSILLGAFVGVHLNSVKGPVRLGSSSVLFSSLAMVMAIWSPVKLLGVAEVPVHLKHWSFWALLSSNIVASGFFYTIIALMARIKGKSVPITDDSAILIENDDLENGKIENQPAQKAAEEEEPEISRKESLALAVRLLVYCVKRVWKWYLAGFTCLFIYSAARIFVPYYTGQIISDIVLTHSYSDLLDSILIMTLLALTSSIFGGVRGGCLSYAQVRMIRDLRNDLFSSLVRQEIGFFDGTKTGEIISRLSADCEAMGESLSSNINLFLRSLVMFCGGLIVMFQMNWRLALLTFIAMPLLTVIAELYGAYYEKLSEQTQELIAKANEVADEVFGSMRTVRSFANEMGERARFKRRLNKTLEVQTQKSRALVGYNFISEAVELGLLIAALWYGGHLVLSGAMKGSHLISFLLYQLQLSENLETMSEVFTGLMQCVGASRKVFEYIDRKPKIPNDGQIECTDSEGKLEFRDVCFSYPTRPATQVLKNVSFSVSPGETVALVGPSGGGKSSCISLLEHFYEPSSGQVLLDGVPVSKYSHQFYHNAVSLVSQEPTLYARSVYENIYYGLDDNCGAESESERTQRREGLEKEAEEAARLANAHTFVMETADGYQTQVGEKGVQMSGGQKQRIAIARALIRKPKVLLLDEATSALDSQSEHLVQQALYNNLAGHTVLLIAHRLSTVERADRIIVVNEGRIEQMGNHRELIESGGLYKDLVQRQLTDFD